MSYSPHSNLWRGGLLLQAASYLTSPVQVLVVLREVVERQEGVGIARGAVAQPVALLQQAVLPDHVSALVGVAQVPLFPEHLRVGHKLHYEAVKAIPSC